MSGLVDVFGKTINSENFDFWWNSSRQMMLEAIGKGGPGFFNYIVLEINKILQADYSYVAKVIHGDKNIVSTIALCHKSEIIENIEYDLKDTPCDNVVGQFVRSYKSNVQEQFSNDILFKDMGIEAYFGVPLFDSKGQPLGIFVILFKNSISDTQIAEFIIQMMANKISNEIELLQTEKLLQNNQEEFTELFNNTPNSLWEQDFSEVRNTIMKLDLEKVNEYSSYIENNPIFLKELLAKVDIKRINKETLTLFEAESEDVFFPQI